MSVSSAHFQENRVSNKCAASIGEMELSVNTDAVIVNPTWVWTVQNNKKNTPNNIKSVVSDCFAVLSCIRLLR